MTTDMAANVFLVYIYTSLFLGFCFLLCQRLCERNLKRTVIHAIILLLLGIGIFPLVNFLMS
jgi:hypothetical protein